MTALGVEQLSAASDMALTREATCCRAAYGVSSAQAGSMFRIKIKSFSSKLQVLDKQDNLIAVFRSHSPWFKSPYMSVEMRGVPPLKVQPKSYRSRSLMIVDQNDRALLRIKRPLSLQYSQKYKILGAEDVQVGSIKKDWTDYMLRFPPDLDVRCKAALLAVCIFDIIETTTATSSSD